MDSTHGAETGQAEYEASKRPTLSDGKVALPAAAMRLRERRLLQGQASRWRSPLRLRALPRA